MTFTRKIYHLIIFSFLFSLVSCGYGKYNGSSSVSSKKVEFENSRVYGDGKGQPARQTKKTYPTPEGAGDRVNSIKEKLYGKPKAANETKDSGSIAATDTTKQANADSAKANK